MSELVVLAIVLGAGLAGVAARRAGRVPLGRGLLLASLAVALLALAIPGLVRGGAAADEAPLVIVIDASESMGPRLADFLDPATLELAPDRELLVLLAGSETVPLHAGPARDFARGPAAPLAFGDPLFRRRADLGRALAFARERLAPRDFALLLVSDGGFDPLPAAIPGAVALATRPGPARRADDLGLEFLSSPPRLGPGDTVALDLVLSGFLAAPRRVVVRAGGGDELSLDLPAGAPTERLRLEFRPPHPADGFLRARLDPRGADADAGNDEARLPALPATVAPPRVLLLQGPRGDPGLRGLLAASPALALLAPDADLDRADLVVIDSLPAASLPVAQDRLRAFVAAGGGLFLCGAEEAFGAGGWESSVLDELSPLQARPGRRPRLVRFALDRSGSMAAEGRLAAAAASVRALFATLAPRDRLELVLFAAERRRAFYERADPDAALRLAGDLARLGAGGGTDLLGLLGELAEPPAGPGEFEVLAVVATDGRDPRGLDPALAAGCRRRFAAAGIGLQVFWFDRDEALRPALLELVGEAARLQEVDDFGRMLEPFFRVLGQELAAEEVEVVRRDERRLVLARLLRTRRAEGAAILAAGAEDENALALVPRGFGRVAAAPLAPLAAARRGLFDQEGASGAAALPAFLVSLADRPAGFELARLDEGEGERLELRGEELPAGELRLSGPAGPLALARRSVRSARSPLAPRPAPAGRYRLLDGDRDLGAVALAPPRRRDAGPAPEPERLRALAAAFRPVRSAGRGPGLLLPLVLLLLLAIDLVLRGRDR